MPKPKARQPKAVIEPPEVRYALEMLRFESVSHTDLKFDRAADVAKYCMKMLRNLGYEVHTVGEGKHFALIGIGNLNDLCFEGHIDIVPFIREDWEHDPLGEIVGDKLYGRGSTDMKGAVAALFAALDKTKARPLVILTTDEEPGAFAGIQMAVDWLKQHNIKPKLAINMESTDLRCIKARKGALIVKLTINGKAAHGSKPELGVNAIELAAKAVQAIASHAKELQKKKDPLLGPRTINIGTIQGGLRSNIVPSHCTLHIDSRLITTETGDEAVKKFHDVLKKTGLKQGKEPGQYELEVKANYPAYRLDDKDLQLILVQEVLKDAGLDAEPHVGTGFTENVFLAKLGMSVVTVGPGNETLHQANEYVDLAKLTKTKEVYLSIISRFTKA